MWSEQATLPEVQLSKSQFLQSALFARVFSLNLFYLRNTDFDASEGLRVM